MNPDPLTWNPYAALGLPAWPDLDDETVHAAWRQIADETHPGRPDGGDLARYTQATAAYYELSCPWGRSEAYADLVYQAQREGHWDAYPDWYPADQPAGEPPPVLVYVVPPLWLADPKGMLLTLPYRLRHGHPAGLLGLAAIGAGLCLAALAIFPGLPVPAVVAAGIIWLFLSVREALAPPP